MWRSRRKVKPSAASAARSCVLADSLSAVPRCPPIAPAPAVRRSRRTRAVAPTRIWNRRGIGHPLSDTTRIAPEDLDTPRYGAHREAPADFAHRNFPTPRPEIRRRKRKAIAPRSCMDKSSPARPPRRDSPFRAPHHTTSAVGFAEGGPTKSGQPLIRSARDHITFRCRRS